MHLRRGFSRFAPLVAVAVLAVTAMGPPAGAITGSRQVKILGGSIAAPGQFPWMVALVDPRSANAADGQFCGGSLIAPRVVLTAAHCVTGTTASEIDAVIGRTLLSRGSDGQRIKVTNIVRSPTFNATEISDDFALLQLATPANATPIALDTAADAAREGPGTEVLVSGWGTTVEGGDGSDDLRFVRLRVRSASACADHYGGGISAARTLCAGSTRAGEDSCQGDSGGPLTRGDGAATRLIGIVSFGDGCGKANVPGVYTRVGAFTDFIAQQIATLNGDAPTPAPVVDPPVVRVGAIACGITTCTVNVIVHGRAPAGGIALNVVRARSPGRKAVDTFVFAKQLTATRFVAHVNLPYGRLTLYAIPLNAQQDDLDGDGDVVTVSISAG